MCVCRAEATEAMYAAHLDNAALARDKLYGWKYKSEHEPWRYGQMMIDGMTKNTTRLPRIKVKAKYWESRRGVKGGDQEMPYYETGLMGSQIAGMPHFCDFYNKNLSDDANFMVEIVHKNIARMQQHNLENNRPNPTTLYIQLDNVGTNKSKLMFIYLSWLVATGVFDKIKVGFLIVGHTHEFIDQFFSRYAILECMWHGGKIDQFFGLHFEITYRACSNLNNA
jgi:hypothetical protein